MHAQINHVAYRPIGPIRIASDWRVRWTNANLLRANGKRSRFLQNPLRRFPADHVRHADEIGDEGRFRAFVYIGWRADPPDLAPVKAPEPLTHAEAFSLSRPHGKERDTDPRL